MQDLWFKPFDGGELAEAGTIHHDSKISVALTRTAFDSYPLQNDGERGQQLILTVLERDLQARGDIHVALFDLRLRLAQWPILIQYQPHHSRG